MTSPRAKSSPSQRRSSPPTRSELGDPVNERLLVVYRRLRLPGAAAAIIDDLILTLATDWVFGWLAVTAASLALADAIRELRRPRRSPSGTILVDATLLGLTMVAIGLPAVSFAYGLWLIILTAVFARGFTRILLYGYVGLWAVAANIVTWSGVRGWSRHEVLMLDWAALLLVGALVISLLQVALRRIREMEAERSYLMGVVGHELGNSLGSVIADVSALERNRLVLSDVEVDEFVTAIRSQAQESADIADDLLTLARLQNEILVVNAIKVDVVQLTASVLKEAEADIALSAPRTLTLDIDPLRYRQIIRNLVLNASRHGGENVSVSIVSDGDVARITVRDDGPGVPTEEMQALFETGTSQVVAGAGLGLWVSHRLAAEMGGDLSYRRDGAWTAFDLVFPQ